MLLCKLAHIVYLVQSCSAFILTSETNLQNSCHGDPNHAQRNTFVHQVDYKEQPTPIQNHTGSCNQVDAPTNEDLTLSLIAIQQSLRLLCRATSSR